MEKLPQWPETPGLRQQYADHLREELPHLSPGQIAVLLSDGLAAVDRSGFSEFVGTPLIASTDPYRPPAKLYACQLVDLAARLMHDPADKLDSVLQSYNASHDKSLDQAKRFFWSDVYRAAADHMASPDCIEIARSILHDPTRLFVEQAKHILSKNWTAAVIDHAFSLLMKHPWTTSKGSEFDVAVKKALLSSRATPVRLAADSVILRHPINTPDAAAAYAAECEAVPDIVVYDPSPGPPIMPDAFMLAKRDRVALALRLLLDTEIWTPIIARVQDEKRLPEGTPGCFAEFCCYLHDHHRIYLKQG